MTTKQTVTSIPQLESIYSPAVPGSLTKETVVITPEYQKLIEASPFVLSPLLGRAGWTAHRVAIVPRLLMSSMSTPCICPTGGATIASTPCAIL